MNTRELRLSAPLADNAGLFSKIKHYFGIGCLISVGYMDPGNWATDIEAGSRFGYSLLIVILIASLVAMLLQTLCVRLGVASGKDLAQLCRQQFSPKTNIVLWFLAEIAIIACDFAEVLGTALALKLLFGLPLEIGILLTAFDTLIILWLQNKGYARVEAIVISLLIIIAGSFMAEIIMSEPDWSKVIDGFVPSKELLNNSTAWLLAIGIFGATVMPHNLYLHSAAVGNRQAAPGKKKQAIKYLTYDILIALGIAFFVNAAILILAGTVFHQNGYTEVNEIDTAYNLLAPVLGVTAASTIFALALFASGQSSTITGTIAGQIIFQGFLNLSMPLWKQRLIVRTLAIVPAWLCISILGEGAIGRLLVISQVVLCMQLPFAVIPLIMFNRNKELMGEWSLSTPVYILCWAISIMIISANIFLIYKLLS